MATKYNILMPSWNDLESLLCEYGNEEQSSIDRDEQL